MASPAASASTTKIHHRPDHPSIFVTATATYTVQTTMNKTFRSAAAADATLHWPRAWRQAQI